MNEARLAAEYMRNAAADASHGYDQASRWGPDYDCSSLVITAYQQAGVPVKTAGATYTGNMKPAFLNCGFTDVTGQVRLGSGVGMQEGDVLLNITHHAAMYLGGGKIAQASINEKGRITGGATGDQTGGEIAVRSYYNFPWDCVLRYTAEAEKPAPAETCAVTAPVIRYGDMGGGVCAMQAALMAGGYGLPIYGADGEYGDETGAALKRFQTNSGLSADGICDGEIWTALLA